MMVLRTRVEMVPLNALLPVFNISISYNEIYVMHTNPN